MCELNKGAAGWLSDLGEIKVIDQDFLLVFLFLSERVQPVERKSWNTGEG